MRLKFDWNQKVLMAQPDGDEELEFVSGLNSRRAVNSDGFWLFPSKFSFAWKLAQVTSTEGRSQRFSEVLSAHLLRREGTRLRHKDRVLVHNDKFFDFQWQNGLSLFHAQSGMLNDSTGLGKTRSMIATFLHMAPPFLVICPKIAMDVWVNELKAVDPGFAVLKIEGTKGQREELLDPANINLHDVVIINYELIAKHSWYPSWGKEKGNKVHGALNATQWSAVVCDEGHRIKEPSTAWTRAAWSIRSNSDRGYLITATPITGTPEDLWAQARFVWPDEMGSLVKFREEYLEWAPGFHGGIDVFGWKPDMQDEYEKCFGWRTSKRSYNDLDVIAELDDFPEEMPAQIITVPMAKAQRDAYKTMLKSWFIKDGDDITIAGSPLEMMIRCRQIANGIPVVNDGEVIGLTMPSSKVNALIEIVENSSVPVLVYTEHTTILALAIEQLKAKGFECGEISGRVPQPRLREKRIEQFQQGRLDVLLCTVGAASESITLTNAGLLVFLQESWSMLHMTQARGRVRRIGSVSAVPIIVLQSEDTVEQSVNAALVEKAGFLDEFMGRPDLLKRLLKGNPYEAKADSQTT